MSTYQLFQDIAFNKSLIFKYLGLLNLNIHSETWLHVPKLVRLNPDLADPWFSHFKNSILRPLIETTVGAAPPVGSASLENPYIATVWKGWLIPRLKQNLEAFTAAVNAVERRFCSLRRKPRNIWAERERATPCSHHGMGRNASGDCSDFVSMLSTGRRAFERWAQGVRLPAAFARDTVSYTEERGPCLAPEALSTRRLLICAFRWPGRKHWFPWQTLKLIYKSMPWAHISGAQRWYIKLKFNVFCDMTITGNI